MKNSGSYIIACANRLIEKGLILKHPWVIVRLQEMGVRRQNREKTNLIVCLGSE